MTDLIERAKEALQGATPGPWEACWPVNPEHPWINAACNHSQASDGREYYMSVSGLCQADDARLIALSPDLARLAVAAGELAEALKTAQDYVDDASRGLLRYRDRAAISDTASDDLVFIQDALARFRAIAEGRE
jgi:hypothetical protein